MAAAGDDEDGNVADSKGGETTQRKAREPVVPITADSCEALRILMKNTDTDEAQYCKFLKINRLEELPLNKYASACDALEEKQKAIEAKNEAIVKAAHNE